MNGRVDGRDALPRMAADAAAVAVVRVSRAAEQVDRSDRKRTGCRTKSNARRRRVRDAGPKSGDGRKTVIVIYTRCDARHRISSVLSRTSVTQQRNSYDMSQFPSVEWCLLAAALLSSAVSRASVTTATAANTDSGGIAAGSGQESSLEPRRTGWLCAPTDTAGVCLFKGLLKNAVPLFAGSWASADRRKDAETAADTGVQQTQSKGIEEYLMEQIQNLLGALSFGFELPTEVASPWTLLKSSFLNGKTPPVGGFYDTSLP